MGIRSEIEVSESDDDISVVSVQEETSDEQVGSEKHQIKALIYRFRMRHFFYIHLAVFIVSGLLAGLIIYLIENYPTLKNQTTTVSYVNAWFVSCTCAYGCGLTTFDFAKLSTVSQIILLVLTFFSGITVSTLPAIAIKAYTHKHIEGMTVDNDHEKEVGTSENSQQSSTPRLPATVEEKLVLLPTPQQIRYWAYIIIIILILATCTFLYLLYFIILGAWLQTRYPGNELAQGNSTVNPWYVSMIIVITGFNQNGLVPFSDGMARFVDDIYMNVFVILVILSGNSLFPFLLRNFVLLGYRLAPWRYKIVFDYILLNHHHFSILLFPTLQTRVYIFVTCFLYLMGISVSLILDLHNAYLGQFTLGTRVLILIFHVASARFAGFQTVDISHFAYATLIIYLLLMATKPQMLCALQKPRSEFIWISPRANQKGGEEEQQEDFSNPNKIDRVLGRRRRKSSTISDETFATRRINLYLDHQHLTTNELIHQTKKQKDNEQKRRRTFQLHLRLFLFKFVQTILKHITDTLGRTNSWLFIIIFLICASEHERLVSDPNITVFKIVFEVVSAFGCVGLSLGYPDISSSFATVLSPTSRVILGLTMLLGRHRGLLASMKDQEKIEHKANELLHKWKEKVIHQCVTEEVPITKF